MNLLNVVGTVVFLGVLALSLLAVLDVLFLRPRAKRSHRPGRMPATRHGSNRHIAREEAFTGEKPNRRH
ncbi:hypothetical protein [Paraburkholderia fungorum]|uniref:hypothetical protein n=1 Tax=Paraburkholderia fungorum TaxID=134537 RepID=UPI0038B7C045